MPGRVSGPIRLTAVAAALVVSSVSIGVRTSDARASECLSAPTSDSSERNHWFYRTNHETRRKCWHLREADRSDDKPSKQSDQKPAKQPDPTPTAQAASDDAPAQATWRHLPNPVSDQELTQDQTECARKGNDGPVGAGSPEFKFFVLFSECMHAAGYEPIVPPQ
jgi:hypothetical protein